MTELLQQFIELEERIKKCNKCGLGKKCNKHVIWAYTTKTPKIVFLGEAPGASEDRLGMPFVGRSGKLLMRWIQELGVEEWAAINCLKCHTNANRRPKPHEIETCRPFLDKQLTLLKPELVVCLGMTAARALGFSGKRILTSLGKTILYKGIKTMVFVHPSYCLRNPNYKVPINIIKDGLK